MSTMELGMSFGGYFFESRGGSSNQSGNKEKGDKRKIFQNLGLRGNGSKPKERTGKSHNRPTSRRPGFRS